MEPGLLAGKLVFRCRMAVFLVDKERPARLAFQRGSYL